MLKLLFFVPCEKIIEGKDNSTSLVSVLEHIAVNAEGMEDVPTNAGLPFTWSAIVLWTRDGDVSKPVIYESKISLIAPNGIVAITGKQEFEVSNQYFNFRNQVNFPIFPIGLEGVYKLTLDYKQKNSEEWENVGEYPIRLIYTREGGKNENKNGNETDPKNTVEGVSSISATSKKTRVNAKKRHPKKRK